MRFTVSRLTACAIAIVLFVACALPAGAVDPWGGFIPHASSYGDRTDNLYWLIYGIVAFTFIGVEGLLVYFLVKYRAKPGNPQPVIYSHGNNTLEVIWTATPALVLLFIALVQRDAWLDIKNTFPSDADPRVIRIEGLAQRFNWNFRYAGRDRVIGTIDDVLSPVLRIPVDHKILLQMRSRDVLHSFFLPHFRVKQDVVPGLTIPIWFEPILTTRAYAQKHRLPLVGPRAFEFEIACAELCGQQHYNMKGKLEVVTRAEFDAWLAAEDPATKNTGGDAAAWKQEWDKETAAQKAAQKFIDNEANATAYADAVHTLKDLPKAPTDTKDKVAMATYNDALDAYLKGLAKEERAEIDAAKKIVDAYEGKVAEIKATDDKRWGWPWAELRTTKVFHQK